MAFLRRKSGVYHDDVYQEDFENQRRRRLSKPHTNTSSTNLSFSVLQSATGRKAIDNKPAVESSTFTPNASKEALRSLLLVSTSEMDIDTPKAKRSTVALMTSKFEKNSQASTSQLSLASPSLPQRPMSHLLSAQRAPYDRKVSISSLGSRDRSPDLDHELGTVSPSSSTNDLVEDPAPPPRRTASFTPGMATRMPNYPPEVIDEESESTIEQAEAVSLHKHVRKILAVEANDGLSPPSQGDRCVTPTDLEYPNIGRLGPGSLRVVNGAPSPAASILSKLSRQLWMQPARRDSSSVYAGSEIGTVKSRRSVKSVWEDEPMTTLVGEEDSRPRPEAYRTFSFNPGSEAKLSYSGRSVSASNSARHDNTNNDPDCSRMMAEEYIAGLPTSPYANNSPISPICQDQTNDEELQASSPPATYEHHDSTSSSSPLHLGVFASSPVSQGSVIRHPDKARSRRSFMDETLGSSPITDRPDSPSPVSRTQRPESPASFLTAPSTDNGHDEAFRSAVELQPARACSPQKAVPLSPLKQSQTAPEPEQGESSSTTKSDSGYSSKTSLSAEHPPLLSRASIETGASINQEQKRGLRFPFRKAAHKIGKGIIVQPTPSTRIPSPTAVRVETASGATSTTSFIPSTKYANLDPPTNLPTSPKKEKEKQRKKLQKFRRKSTVDVAGELVVQRMQSIDGFNVPAVSQVSKSNLAQRARAVPELERTFKTQDSTRTSTNASTLTLTIASQDIRFPSPEPVEEERAGRSQDKPKPDRRRRSISRPRSWFGRPKETKAETKFAPQRNSRADLQDLGSVVDILGDNPYDMASGKSRGAQAPSACNNRPEMNRRQTTPSNITTNAPRQRQTMGDQEAAMLSKWRRSSSTDRKSVQPTSRHSFDDRGGVPGKMPHSHTHTHSPASPGAPPLPAMPSPAEINRRMSYRNSYATHPSPLPYQNVQYSEPPSVRAERDAPPPPPHSPRPSYIDNGELTEQENFFEQAPLPPRHSPAPSFIEEYPDHEQAVDNNDSAPPPPCHSPRPADVTNRERSKSRSRDISWSNQANAWKVRRRSAGEALKDSWSQIEEYVKPAQQTARPSSGYEEMAYALQAQDPVRDSPYQQEAYSMWRNGAYHEQDYFDHSRDQTQSVHPQHHGRPQSYHDYGNYEQDQHVYDQFSQSRPNEYFMYSDHSEVAPFYSNYFEEPQAQRYGDYESPSRQSYDQSRRKSSGRFYEDYNQGITPPLPPIQRAQTYDNSYTSAPPSSFYAQATSNHHQTDAPQQWVQGYDNYQLPVARGSQGGMAQQWAPRYDDYQRPIPRGSHHSRSTSRHSVGRSPQRRAQPYDNYQRPMPSAFPQARPTSSHSNGSTHHQRRSQLYDNPEFPVPQAGHHPRPTSSHSNVSRRSLAQELHPELFDGPYPSHRPRDHSPQIGRYSGGLEYNYDRYSRGFDGSAGTRSASTAKGNDVKRDGKKRSSWLDMENYGVDLGDVPAMSVPVGATGSRMVYH